MAVGLIAIFFRADRSVELILFGASHIILREKTEKKLNKA